MKVVVTGASGGLGRATISVLLDAGHQVFAIARSSRPYDLLAPESCLAGVDLSRPDQAQTAIATALKQLGGVDALVNIAGGFRWETIAEGSPDTWDEMLSINLRTALNACSTVLPHLGSGSSIVTVGAASAASSATTGMGAYIASKSALLKFTEALADEAKAAGVRVNMVSPTVIDTPANRRDMPDENFDLWVSPTEIANLIQFLISDLASGITGANIPITGRA